MAQVLFTTQDEEELVSSVHFKRTQELLRKPSKISFKRRGIEPKEPLVDFLGRNQMRSSPAIYESHTAVSLRGPRSTVLLV